MTHPPTTHAGPDHVRTLTGHSGCSVALMIDGDEYYVRKTSASPAYNQRLVAQIRKQIQIGAVLATPKVLRQGVTDELVWFDMEFVRGDGFLTFAPLQSIATLPDLVGHLSAPLRALAETADGTLDASLFTAKIEQLRDTVPASPFHPDHAHFLGPLLERLASADWNGIPRSLCHGDLTVENMLIRDNGTVVFIDLLDGDLESVWMDVAKLLQDLESGWSMRSVLWQPAPDPSARLLRTLGHYLAEELHSLMSTMLPPLSDRLPQLRALQALRVLPYVRNESTFDHVVAGLKRIPPIEVSPS
jgi:aminoglycoside phosphotransferase